ncbi:MAG: hypothetical protein QM765_36770 [Myxococcales bacterium]
MRSAAGARASADRSATSSGGAEEPAAWPRRLAALAEDEVLRAALQLGDELLALAHQVVLEDLPDAPRVADDDLALLLVERVGALLLEHQDAVVARAGDGRDHDEAVLADDAQDGRGHQLGEGAAHQLVQRAGLQRLALLPGAVDEAVLRALEREDQLAEASAEHPLDLRDQRLGGRQRAQSDAYLLGLLVEEDEARRTAAQHLGGAAQHRHEELFERRRPGIHRGAAS